MSPEHLYAGAFLRYAQNVKNPLYLAFIPHFMAENESPEVDKGGRPTDYRVVFNKQAFRLCLLGSTDKQLADFFEVSESTLNNWKIRHPKFLESIKKGRDEADAKVGQALYQRACGYEAPDLDIRVVGNVLTQTKIKKHLPPDPLSMIFWLKNRRPDLWREKKEIDHKFDGPVTIQYGEKPGNDPIIDDEPGQ
jgi:hypothetical protein